MILNEKNVKLYSSIGSRATFGLVALDLVKETCTSKLEESIDLSIKINTKQSKGGDDYV